MILDTLRGSLFEIMTNYDVNVLYEQNGYSNHQNFKDVFFLKTKTKNNSVK